MRLKRVLSLTMTLCLCLAMLPTVTALAADTGNVTVCGVDIGVKAGTHMQYSNSNGALAENGYYYDGVYLYSTQCLGFARWCQYKLFGYHKASAGDKFYYVTVNGVYRVYPGNLTTKILKELVLASKPGAHLRTYSSGHSMIITEITEDGFSIVQCNGSNNNEYSDWKQNYIGTYTYTWDSYVSSTYGARGIEFIELPYDYPYGEDHTEHRFTGHYYDSEHPHKVYARCFCGERQYTEETTRDIDCPICNPVDSRYDGVLPFRAYLKDLQEVYPFTTPEMETLSGGEIWAEDECTVLAVYANGACKVSYPAGSSFQTAYLPVSVFLQDTTAPLTMQKTNCRIITYKHTTTAYGDMYGYTGAGDEVYTVGNHGNMTQVFYHTASGYKLAWVLTGELSEVAYDSRFGTYGTIYAYPCATANFNAYEADRTTYSGKIYTTDDCTIHAIYADGWCQVTYPVSSGTRIGYTQFSNFIRQTELTHIQYTAREQTTTYADQKLTAFIGALREGTVFYVVGTYGDATQILYPSETLSAGYQLAWIGDWEPSETVVHRYYADGKEYTAYYRHLEEALAAANSGTIALLADTVANAVFVNPNVTLDLSGKTLTANTVVVMNGATISDGGIECTGGGLLKIAREHLIFARNNGENIIPVWNGTDGYIFTKVVFQQLARSGSEGAAQYIFLPNFSNAQAAALLADGGQDNGIAIKVCLSWAEGQSQQFYTYSEELVQQVFQSEGRLAFDLTVTGIADITDMTASAVVVGDCDAQATAPGISLVTG